MKIEKIAYEQLYPTGVYANQRYRVEIALEESDYDVVIDGEVVYKEEAAEKAFAKAKDIVEKTFTALNPQINWNENAGLPNPYGSINVYAPLQETQVEKPIGVTIDDINSCSDKKILETYKFLIKGKPELEEAYLAKLKTFIK